MVRSTFKGDCRSRRFKRLSHGTDRASILELTMDPALASQPFAVRLLQLHDGDGDGILTQVIVLKVLPTLLPLLLSKSAVRASGLHKHHFDMIQLQPATPANLRQ